MIQNNDHENPMFNSEITIERDHEYVIISQRFICLDDRKIVIKKENVQELIEELSNVIL